MRLSLLERLTDWGACCEFCRGDGQATESFHVISLFERLFCFQKMEQERAAALIQRNYRGYRERRQLKGLGLSASTRWREALDECQSTVQLISRTISNPQLVEYRQQTRPLSQDARSGEPLEARARQNWRRIGVITRRAAGDDESSESEADDDLSPEQLEAYRQHKMAAKREREVNARLMGLQYWLEAVDSKHRYGSNLRTYHQEWLKSDTHENFFYWLDHGEGKSLDLPIVPRSRLDAERVRYLSREERQKYLVRVDNEGKLCWAHNGERISTSPLFKDTVNGIVPVDDADNVAWTYHSDSSTSSLSTSSTGPEKANQESQHYVNHDLNNARGWRKLKHVSASTIANQLLQRSVRPNSWIFVADTSFRLYIGIKNSGAFQHSSFLSGARVSAAGLIKIKDGQLRRLSPLSGHYRAPTKNFRLFVHSLKDEGVDMSRVSISRAYAVLLGLEAYTRTKKKLEHGLHHAVEEKDQVLHPHEVRKREEEARDKSKSAEIERTILQQQALKDQQAKHSTSLLSRLLRKLNWHSEKSKEDNPTSTTPESLVKPGEEVKAEVSPASISKPADVIPEGEPIAPPPVNVSTVLPTTEPFEGSKIGPHPG
jgi:hypothetical protein